MEYVEVSVTEAETEHDFVWSILPWYVNGSLTGAERTRVDTHLKECLSCRREFAALKILATHTALPIHEDECEAALRRLTQRLDRVPSRPRHLPWAAAATLVLTTGLISWLADNAQASTAWLRNAGYSMRTADAARPGLGGPQVRLAFDDDITERQLRSLVLGVGAAVVEGPTPQGIYTLEFSRSTAMDEVMEAIRKLRYSRRVIFAEPAMATAVSDHPTHW